MWKSDLIMHPWLYYQETVTTAGHLKIEFDSRDDLLWGFLSLQKLGQGISKGFQHSHVGGLGTDRVEIRLENGSKGPFD